MQYRTQILKRKLLAEATQKVTPQEEDLIVYTSFKKLVVGLAERLDPQFVNELLAFVKKRDVMGLLTLTAAAADPQKYESAEAYWPHAVIAAFLDKFPFRNVPNLNPRKKALERSARAELLCRLANQRLSHYRGREYRLPKNRRYLCWVFHSARLKISRWLGPLDLNEIADNAKHGPGGCLGVKRPKTTRYYKYASESYTMAARCSPYARALFETNPIWVRSLSGLGPFDAGPPLSPAMAMARVCKVTDYNKVTYVPKTARTDRAIAVEPMLNIYFQLGVGATLRDRLRKVGLDLNSAWERNKKLALEGSLSDDPSKSIASIDLSMASDTLATELVREMLPPDWFDLMYDLRSPKGNFGDHEKPWAKFSSMGNGYTFELETLIFYALSQSVCEYLHLGTSKVSVYGDDILVPSKAAPALLDVLKFCGFVPNEDKTFISGHFRESCGGDYFKGVDVRPFYLKRRLRVKQDLIFLRNSFYLLLTREDWDLTKIRDDIVGFIDSRLPKLLTDHLLGPTSGPIDGTIFTPWDKAHKSYLVKWDRDVQEMRYPVLNQVARRFRGWSPFIYLQFLEGTGLAAEHSRALLQEPVWGDIYPKASSQSVVTRSMSGVTQLHLNIAYSW